MNQVLDAIYRPWLESAALHLQVLADKELLANHPRQETESARVESGTVILFADGLRFDVAQRLVERLQTKGGPNGGRVQPLGGSSYGYGDREACGVSDSRAHQGRRPG